MTERTPLLHYRLSASLTEPEQRAALERSPAAVGRKNPENRPHKLSTFFGVVVPTLLSMFSVVVFLRIGFVVGQSGLYQTFGMLLVAYFIICMTVLSVCAISTNGALDAGGAYYMISRALGPEFGGSIGIMFFFANVCGSALYVLGLVEAILSTFGVTEDLPSSQNSQHVLPGGYWWSLLYATGILLICLLVCLVGAHIYARATFLIFLIVIVVLGTIFISFFAVTPKSIPLPVLNASVPTSANFTGFKLETLLGNLDAGYSMDYTTGTMMTFATVFAVMFNGCTGIMAGSNMSGDLKNPSYSIPRGTITAVIFTFITYNMLSLLVACTCERLIIRKTSTSLGFGSEPIQTCGGVAGKCRIQLQLQQNISEGFEAGGQNSVSQPFAPPNTPEVAMFIFRLESAFIPKVGIMGIVTLTGLLKVMANTPPPRPTFRYFTWHTCVLGIVGCGVMMFLINAIYASASIAFMLLLLLVIHYLSPTSSWGYISQALIFHQVRKYLLMLDVRKDHVKFWRPQVLLMVANPRSSVGLITFINDIKKSGLYVLGHVTLGDLDTLPSDPLQSRYDSWLSLVDHLNIKAFVNLTLADSVRHGIQHLLFISGLGGMRPNTLVLGFYDDCDPQDTLQDSAAQSGTYADSLASAQDLEEQLPLQFPALRSVAISGGGKALGPREYVSIVADAVKMLKNVVLARYFCRFARAEALGRRGGTLYVDVWPLNLLRPDSSSYVDTCSLFLLQMACVLNMVRAWRHARLRLFLCVEEGRSLRGPEEKLGHLLRDLRISADVHTVPWDQVAALHWQRQDVALRGQRHEEQEEPAASEEGDDDFANSFPSNTVRLSDDYLRAVNHLVLQQSCPPPAVRFLYLPRPPADTHRYLTYLHQLDLLTRDLGPTLLIHGVTPVITTDL
ncbi:Solute carrier family 12 member 9-like [Arapaima gigas]